MNHRISAGVIVQEAGRLLMVRHAISGQYDFWVAPGGGVQGEETLAQAAQREVFEETGLTVDAGQLLYIEEFTQPGTRHCKFWFAGHLRGGTLNVTAPEATAEHIVEAAWLTPQEIAARTSFPLCLQSDYWQHQTLPYQGPLHLGLRKMAFW